MMTGSFQNKGVYIVSVLLLTHFCVVKTLNEG